MRANPLIVLLSAWVGWAAGFLLLYAVQATGCRMGLDDQLIGSISVLRLLLIKTTVVLVLGLVGLTWMAHRKCPPSPLATIGAYANGAAILATLCFSGVLWLSMCA